MVNVNINKKNSNISLNKIKKLLVLKCNIKYTKVILFSKINYTYKCLEYSIYLVQECRDMMDCTCRKVKVIANVLVLRTSSI